METVAALTISFIISQFIIMIYIEKMVVKTIKRTYHHHHQPPEIKTGFPTATVFINNVKFQTSMIEVKDTQGPFSIEYGAPVDAKNNPAKVQDDKYTWASGDESVATVEQDASNPLKATVTLTGKTGVLSITISADADLGEGVKTITGTENLSVIAGEAVGFGSPVITGLDA